MRPSFIIRPRSSRALHLVLATLVLGALLAVAPRPAFAVERGARVDTETPDLVPVTAARDDATVAEPGGIEAAPTDEAGAAAADGPARLGAEASDVDGFQMIGASFEADQIDDGRIRISIDGQWEPWQPLTGLDGDHGPDPGTAEAEAAQVASDPIWVGDGDGYELDLPADASGVEVHLVRETEEQVRIVDGTAEAGGQQMPTVRSRGEWGARNPKESPQVAPNLNLGAVVHHTVTSNSYGTDSVPAMLRSIQTYHMDTNGWADIGYNFVVDRFGRTWEGRSRSTSEAVVGAHAYGSNTGSTGIAWLGDGSFVGLTPPGREAIAQLIAWKLPLHGNFFPSPSTEIRGHRDVALPDRGTECPGNEVVRLQELKSIRSRAVQLRASGPFIDVPDGAAYSEQIAWGKSIGIPAYPDGTFRPDTDLTRGQFVNMMWILSGRPQASSQHGFTDVSRTSWLTPVLDWAKEQQLINGYPDGEFKGDRPVHRDHFVIVIWKWATSPVVASPHEFSDVDPSGPSDEALRWEKGTGLVGGYPDGSFKPAQPIPRGLAVAVLYKVRPLSDVPAAAAFSASAHWGYHQRVAVGFSDRSFRASERVSRAQALSNLWRMADRPEPSSSPTWPDVGGGAWFESSARWAVDLGLTPGSADLQLRPDDPLRRRVAVLWVWRAAGSPAATEPHGLSDVPGGAAYGAALDWAGEHGLVSGYPDNTFRPNEPLNRAQWIMTLYRLASTPAAWAGGATPPTTTLF